MTCLSRAAAPRLVLIGQFIDRLASADGFRKAHPMGLDGGGL
jgi:hypothetical protein